MTRKELRNRLINDLSVVVDHREAEAMARVILEDIAGLNVTKILTDGNVSVEPRTEAEVLEAASRVVKGEPVQYVVGSAMFHGLRLSVDTSVLIPRPETSGLVDIIEDRYKNVSDLRILDIGTGSGAIALALARNLPFSEVTAIDISDKALAVAEKNRQNLGARNVSFERRDVLSRGLPDAKFDIIVSNPPYVLESERSDIDSRVLDYEPSMALFVPDDNPLLFYRVIAEDAINKLNNRGMLFFEINPSQADAISRLLNSLGFKEVEIRRDFDGKQRYAIATIFAS